MAEHWRWPAYYRLSNYANGSLPITTYCGGQSAYEIANEEGAVLGVHNIEKLLYKILSVYTSFIDLQKISLFTC